MTIQHTLGVLIVRLLQVLHNAILTNELLNLPLCVDVEGIFVELLNLLAALTLSCLLLFLPGDESLSPCIGIHDCGGEFGILRAQAGYLTRVAQELLS